ncbi:helix-turn-helix transcriptional regulator [Micromonospora sp. WMMD1082]|uniref:helix-turn-helix domain-containing protein n=1 Tax=Micromonospora sp. WMMD1082 TaxID=3016104 RepID=UPI002416ABDE|nr:helix-turn-helix transcriptional regulator [Micromonospora sp. WMMD1082]MDG4795308.1 helix-turn-helix transcriptional regulator [Micromonospora sp. WMMD1082]
MNRGLGAELRRLRKAKGLAATAVAGRLDWQPSKLSRMETGQQGIRPEEVGALLVIYEVTGVERRRLIGMAERSRERGWWETHAADLSPWSRTFLRLEADAVAITNWEPLLVPGLLQLPDYTTALMRACGIADAELRVAARLSRQAILARDSPPRLHAIIDEMVFRRVLGGRQLMGRQLRHLIEVAERPNVTMQITPLALGAHTGLDGSFVLLDFDRAPSIVHLEHKLSSAFLEEASQIEVYRGEVDRLAEVALSPAKSTDFVARVAAEYERE